MLSKDKIQIVNQNMEKIQIRSTQIRTPARMAEDASEDAGRRNSSALEMRMKPPGTRLMT